MTRQITSAVSNALQASHVNLAFLLELSLDGGSVYLWSGEGGLNWDGKVWNGVGALGSISAITEEAGLSDVRIKAHLSHVPIENMPDFVDEFTLNNPVGRPFQIHIVFFNDDTSINDVMPLTAGFIDGLNIFENGDSQAENIGGIELVLASESALLAQTRVFRFTDQHQRSLFPGDRGLEFVTDSSLSEIRWGQGDAQKLPSSQGGGISYRDTNNSNVML
jgi:hypothetical protein